MHQNPTMNSLYAAIGTNSIPQYDLASSQSASVALPSRLGDHQYSSNSLECVHTYGIYLILASSSITATTSSGNCPLTFVAYTPFTYPSSRCHFATQLLLGSASAIRPSKTWDVQSMMASMLPSRWRNSSQFGHPSLRNRWRS